MKIFRFMQARMVNSIVFVFLSAAVLFFTATTFADVKNQNNIKPNFGIVCNPYNQDWEYPEKTVTLYKELGVKIAICNLKWKDVEEKKGVFTEKGWKVFDEIVNKLTSCGIDVMCIIAAPPGWAVDNTLKLDNSNGKKSQVNPDDLRDFVAIAAQRYKDRIKYWAMFNSPQGKAHRVEPKHLAELYRVGSQAIKSKIPDSVIVMAGLEGTIDKRGPYLEKFLQAGGGKYIGMYDFHMNLGGGVRFSAAASDTNALMDILKRYNQSGKPIQYGAIAIPNRFESNEKKVARLKTQGWKAIDFERITPELQAIRLVTLMIWGRSLGADKIFWTRTRDYAPESGPQYEKWLSERNKRKSLMKEEREYNRTMGIIDYNYEPKPSFRAFKTLIEKLDAATFLKELPIGENAKAFIFQKAGKYLGVFWTWEGEKTLTLATDAKNISVSNLYGKIISSVDVTKGKLTLRLTPSLVYVEGDFKEMIAP